MAKRQTRESAPLMVGALTALVTVLTTSLDVFNLPDVLKLAITGGAAVLAGLIAWGTQRAVKHDDDEPAAVEAGHVAPAQLPPVIAHFTGRDAALTELHRVFTEHSDGSAPVVSIHGAAGVGKSALATRLAHEIADRYPDGQLYADLRGGGGERVSAEEVLIGFLPAIGARPTTDVSGLPELQNIWRTRLTRRRVLIYLDNARDADQVLALLPPDSGSAVVVTSRQPLLLRNTSDTQLPRFTQLQSVELLARLAGDERVAADLDSAILIAELCDQLPLAVSICGGRLAARRTWSLRELADRLLDERRRRLDELEIAHRIDQSVRASLRLSYDDCTGPQRRLLRSLAALAAPDVPGWVAGELLNVSEVDGVDLLEALVDAQLVEYGGASRYRLHDLVRLYAREQPDPSAAALERVIRGYAERAELVAAARWPQDWHRDRINRDAPPSMEWLTGERLALLALIGQAAELEQWTLVWRLGRAVCSLCHSLRVFWAEWRTAADAACTAAGHTEDARSLGIALLERATASGTNGTSTADATRAVEIFEELDEPWWAARARRSVGMSLRDAGNLDAAQAYLATAIEAFDAVGDRWWRARTQRNLAELRLAQRRHVEARRLLEEALAVFEHDGNRYSEAQTMRSLGEVLAAEARAMLEAGDHEGAERQYRKAGPTLERASETFRLRGEQWEEARCLRAAGEAGDPSDGLRELSCVRRAKAMLEGLGDTWGVARTLVSEGRALQRLDRGEEAVQTLRFAALAFHELEDRWWQARSLRTLAEALLAQGRDATEPATEALTIYRSLGNQSGETRAREVLARAETP